MRYVTNKGIIHELLDNEIIIANLDSGIYCSIREVGVPIWQLLVAGEDEQSIADALVKHYGLTVAEALLVTQNFLMELVAAEVLVIIAVKVEQSATLIQAVEWPVNYSEPLFERFDDMKNLLMLDPIHEVDEQGWPNKPE